MELQLDELIDSLSSFHDAAELVVLLEIDGRELLERFRDRVEVHQQKFRGGHYE